MMNKVNNWLRNRALCFSVMRGKRTKREIISRCLDFLQDKRLFYSNEAFVSLMASNLITSMEKQAHKKFGWKIKNFSSLECEKCYSVPVQIGDCKWRLLTYHMNKDGYKYLSLYVEVLDFESLPCGWGRYVKLRLTLVDQLDHEFSIVKEMEHCFDNKSTTCGFDYMFPFYQLHNSRGFLVNGDAMIFAELNVFEVVGTLVETEKPEEAMAELDVTEVVGTLDESEKPAEATEILSNKKDNEGAESSCVVKKTLSGNESNDVNETKQVNGFHVLPSQVESAERIFERHPDIALEFRAKNQHMRTTYMNFLLSLIETLCQPLQELFNEDMVEADIALTYLKDVGFKVDWLEKKLDQLKGRKEKEQFGLARLKEVEDNLLKLKQKCSELDALVEKEEAELSATRTPVSFDDVV